MFRFLLFALVATVIFAQESSPFPEGSSPLPEGSSSTQVPTIQAGTFAGLFTGGNQEYLKVVKGDWRHWRSNPSEFRSYIRKASSNQPFSYWHDIPLFFNQNEQIYNMVVEIPRGGAILTGVNLGMPMNPVTVLMDPETGVPMKENVDYIHNHGILPQTFHPATLDEMADEAEPLNGTGKPLAVFEMSEAVHQRGDIVPIKILGVLGVIDNGESNYILIGFDIRSPMAPLINSLADFDDHFPDLSLATRSYFRYYRFPQVNQLMFDGAYQSVDFANKLIANKTEQWRELITMQNPPAGYALQCHVDGALQQADDAAWNSIISP
jgi:inorganic pyrophosphatase